MSGQEKGLRPLGSGARIFVRLIESPMVEIASLPLTCFWLLGKAFQKEKVVEIAENGRQTVSDLISGGTDSLLAHFGRSLWK